MVCGGEVRFRPETWAALTKRVLGREGHSKIPASECMCPRVGENRGRNGGKSEEAQEEEAAMMVIGAKAREGVNEN